MVHGVLVAWGWWGAGASKGRPHERMITKNKNPQLAIHNALRLSTPKEVNTLLFDLSAGRVSVIGIYLKVSSRVQVPVVVELSVEDLCALVIGDALGLPLVTTATDHVVDLLPAMGY